MISRNQNKTINHLVKSIRMFRWFFTANRVPETTTENENFTQQVEDLISHLPVADNIADTLVTEEEEVQIGDEVYRLKSTVRNMIVRGKIKQVQAQNLLKRVESVWIRLSTSLTMVEERTMVKLSTARQTIRDKLSTIAVQLALLKEYFQDLLEYHREMSESVTLLTVTKYSEIVFKCDEIEETIKSIKLSF